MNKEDSVISIKFYSMQKQIDELQQELNQKNKIIEEIKSIFTKAINDRKIKGVGYINIDDLLNKIEELEKGSEK